MKFVTTSRAIARKPRDVA